MLNKKLICIAILIFCLVNICAVSASTDIEDNIVSADVDDEIVLEKSIDEDALNNDVQENLNENDDSVLASSEDDAKLRATSNSFTRLNTIINSNHNDEVYLDDDYTFNISVDQNYLDGIPILRSVKIYGNGHTIDGMNVARIFRVLDGNAEFYNINFLNGYSTDPGGAINGKSTAIDCFFSDNKADRADGGATYGVTAINSTFMNNVASYGNGGAMYGGDAVNCIFFKNYATTNGGAICNGNAVNCKFFENWANYHGGAMYNGYALNCSFKRNTAQFHGGATYDVDAVLCSFDGNTLTDVYNDGSAMYNGRVYLSKFDGSEDYEQYVYGTEVGTAEIISENMELVYGSNNTLPFYISAGSVLDIDLDTILEVIDVNTQSVRTIYALSNRGWVVDLDCGEYAIHFILPNYTEYVPNGYASQTARIKVLQCPTSIELFGDKTTVDYQTDDGVTFILKDQYGNVLPNAELIIDYGEPLNFTTNEFGEVSIPAFEFPIGETTVNVTFNGSLNYQKSNLTVNITAVNWTTHLTFNNITTDYNSNEYIIINLTNVDNLPIADANVTVSFNGTENYTTDGNGMIKIPIKGTDAGNYPVFAYYSGSEYDSSAYAYGEVIINKLNTTIAVNVVRVNKNNITMTVKVNSAATGFIELTGDGSTIYLPINNGTATYSAIMGVGNHNFDVKYAGDTNYNPNSTTQSVNIKGPVESEIDADIDVNRTKVTIKIKVEAADEDEAPTSDPEGNVTIKIDDKTYIVALDDGEATFEGEFDPDYYDVTITYLGDDNYNRSSTNTDFTVDEPAKKEPTIVAVPLVMGTSVTMMIIVSDDQSTSMTDYFATLVGGENETDFSKLAELIVGMVGGDDSDEVVEAVGNIIVSVIQGHTPDAQSITTIAKEIAALAGGAAFGPIGAAIAPVAVDIIATLITSGEEEEGTENATGFVTMDINGTKYAVELESGMGLFSAMFAPGDYQVELEYKGDENYAEATGSAEFTVEEPTKMETGIQATTTVNGTSIAMLITVSETNSSTPEGTGITGYVIIEVDGKTYAAEVADGVATFTEEFMPGDYEANLTYIGDENYGQSQTTAEFTVDKIVTNLTAGDLVIGYRDGSAWTVNLTDANGNVLSYQIVGFGICGKVYNVTTDAEGIASLAINLAPGTYDINATFEETDMYNSSFVNATVTVDRIVTNLSAVDLVMSYKDGSAWAVNLTDAEGNAISGANVAFGIEGKTYNIKTDAEGIAKLLINLNCGTYTVNATFGGSKRYSEAFVNATVTVDRIVTNLSAVDLVMGYKDGSAWAVNLADAEGNAISGVNVAFGICGKIYNIKTDVDGIAELPINLYYGTYDVNATFVGNKTYSDAFVNATVTVMRFAANLSACDLVMSYNDGSAWTVNLTDENGNFISNATVGIGICGKVYNIKTDALGIASLAINLAPGTYDVNATFGQTNGYTSAFVNATITVGKASAVLYSEDLEMNYMDGSYYMVTVVGANGNVVDGAVVKFTVSSSSYNIKTNSVGVAKLPINLTKGEYEITAVLNDAKYESNEVLNTITVKKYAPDHIVANDINMTYKDGTAYEVQVVDDEGNNVAVANLIVKITVQKTTYVIKTDANGIASVPINLIPGTYGISADYNGNRITNVIIVNRA